MLECEVQAGGFTDEAELYSVEEVTLFEGNNGLPYDLKVWYPLTAEDELPVMLFLGGFNGLAPATAYTTLFRSLSSRGVIIVAPSGGTSNPRDPERTGGRLPWPTASNPGRCSVELARRN